MGMKERDREEKERETESDKMIRKEWQVKRERAKDLMRWQCQGRTRREKKRR